MADIFRAPTYAKHHRRPEPPPQWVVPNLLTSTLFVAAAALPFNNAGSFPTQVQHPSHARSANADTSRGTPKALTLDATTPAFDAPTFAPQHSSRAKYLNADTTADIPKTLFADAVAPLVDAPTFAAQHPRERHWLNSDTTDGTPVTLFPVVAATAPIVNAPSIQVDGKRWVEVRSDVPPNLTLALPPDMIASGIPETLAIYRQPVRPADTSFRASVVLDQAVTPPPFVNPPHWTPAKFWWQPDDSSSGTPKPLFADATDPAFNPPHVHAHRLRPVADTSQGSPRQLVDGIAPPVVNAPFVAADRVRAVWDTSHGTPKTLFGDATVPVFNPPQFLLDRVRPVTDTTHGLNQALDSYIPPPPFAQTDWPPPIAYRHLQVHGWDQQAAVWTIPDAIPDAVPAAGGGGGKPKRRHQIRVGDRILEGSKEQIEAIARELAIREREAAPEVVEIVVPSKGRKPALTAKTQLAADVRAAYSKAVAGEVARQLELDDEEALIALLT